MGKHWRYGVILDAGSSGTRLHIYRWQDPEKALKHALKHGPSDALTSLPKIMTEKKWTKKIHPGVSTFGNKVSAVGPGHLQSLVDHALQFIPHDRIQDTPIFLMATAGMRLLPQVQQTALTHEICTYLRKNTEFSLPDCDLHIQVIKGETEGLYGWIASNYLLGGFDNPDKHQHGKGHHTYGFLDMGGASAQIAFAPNTTEAEKHANDLKLLRLRTLDGTPAEYKVFTTTWLGFGVNQARESYVENLEELYGVNDPSSELPDPCLPKGLRTNLDGKPITDIKSAKGKPTIVGTGAFDECLRQTYPLLGKDKPCEDKPCLINGQHVPAIDFDVNHFIGVSEYWHTTHGVFGPSEGDKAYDFATYQKKVKAFCAQDWTAIKSSIDARKNKNQYAVQDAQEACFKASWLINVLHDGIGVPRLGIEGDGSLPKVNVSKGALESAKDKGFLEPFQPVDKVDGIEVSWTLGKMVLYAAGQVPPKDMTAQELPVGYGSNPVGISSSAGSKVPADWQFPGSSWKHFSSGHHKGNGTLDGDDDWEFEEDEFLHKKGGSTTTGFFAFVALLVLLIYWFRKRDRRVRLYTRITSFVRRSRKQGGIGGIGGGHGGPLSSFTSKIFGGVGGSRSGNYERVSAMEEGMGGADQFELGDVDSSLDDSDSSDGGSGSGISSSSSSSRFGGKPQPQSIGSLSALDRSGLVVRTESRERLMLPPFSQGGVGRRSRAGSPTRMKSPLTSPHDEI
ncbi:nucleoside phosphatase family-domain-containing protein [Cladorrhinum sp. PSN259]|nr:nucleoside phosphatase family-domain-containing protein [Cladorrhinum sp. PSN259]